MKPRILVVEDNPLSRELLCDWLETEGYEVTSTADLKSAFAAVRSCQPHAVLLDIQVGGDDGLALATWIRQEPAFREIPVIAVTAHAMADERNVFFKAVVTLIFPSPLTSPLFKSNCIYSRVAQHPRKTFFAS
jgi:CheY-like chemotaxis protein